MAARFVLINPWIYDFAAANLWAKPLGLLRVAEWLSAYTPHLRLIDCLDAYTPRRYATGRYPKAVLPAPPLLQGIPRRYGRYGIPEEEFNGRLRNALPADAIFVTGIMAYWYPGVQAAIRICRELAPGVPVILGGLYARLYPQHARAHSGADAVHAAPAEDGLLARLRELGLELRPWRAPEPYYRLGFYPALPYAPLEISSGCPYACAYCAAPRLHAGYRRRDPEAVLTDLRALARGGTREVAFYDDALLFRAEEHLAPLLDRVMAEELPLRFHTPNGLHARFLGAPLARRLRRAGFKTLRLSLETIDPDRQGSTGGKVATAEFETALENLGAAGFVKSEVGVYLMYGLPGQGWDEVRAGADYLMRRGVRICLTEYSPIPGTPLWDDLVRRGTIPADLDPLLTNNSVFATLYAGYKPEDVNALKLKVAEYNHRP